MLLDVDQVDPNLGDDFDGTPLLYAARYGHMAVVKLLLEKGVDVDSADKAGFTLLFWADVHGDKVMVALPPPYPTHYHL